MRDYLVLLSEIVRMVKRLIFRRKYTPPPKEWGKGTKGNVLLIPGLNGTWWFLKKIGNELNGLGYRIYTIPSIEPNIKPINYCVEEVAKVITKNRLTDLVLIGHSKGGIIIRKLLLDPKVERKVKNAFTIASPHQGTVLSSIPFSRIRELFGILKELRSAKVRTEKIINIYPLLDQFIIPNKNMFLPGARNIKVSVAGHVNILKSNETLEVIKKYLPK